MKEGKTEKRKAGETHEVAEECSSRGELLQPGPVDPWPEPERGCSGRWARGSSSARAGRRGR